MNHRYIDESSVAERYLEHKLAPFEHAEFETHLVGCEECSDRLLLAQIFLDKRAQDKRNPRSEYAIAENKNADVRTNGTERRAHGSVLNIGMDRIDNEAETASHWDANGADRSGASSNGKRNAASIIPTDRSSERVVPLDDSMPWPARFVAQFRPWELALLLAFAAALLLSVPTAYYFWELLNLRAVH